MKKFLAILMAAAMVMCLVPAALADGEVIFTVSTVDASAGDTVAVTIDVSGADYEAHGLTLQLNYDTTALTIASVVRGAMLVPTMYGGQGPDDAMIVEDHTTIPGSLRLGAICPTNPITAHGTLLTVNFTVAEGVTTNQLIDIAIMEFFNMPVGETVATPIAYIENDGAINVAGGEVTSPPTDEPTPPPTGDDLSDALNAMGCYNVFTSTGTYTWVVDNTTYAPRTTAMSATMCVSGASATVSTTTTLNAGDLISFDYCASTESNWDIMTFSINGTASASFSGDTGWMTHSEAVSAAGTYTLTWTYAKDGSVNGNLDTCWLDNVYTGAPVEVTGIEVLETLDVPLNRSGLITYTILPENASDKSVTFLSDDPTIATVNANGVVTGVAEGETFVTVTSVANPDAFGVCEITVTDTGLTAVTFYGMCSFDIGGTYTDQWISFPDYDPTDVTAYGETPTSFAAAYAYGIVYGFETANGGGRFFMADVNNIAVAAFPGATYSGTVCDMAYSYTDGLLYGVASNASDERVLIAVDPASGAVSEVGAFNYDGMMTIAIDYNNHAYGVGLDGMLYSINLGTAACTAIGATGYNVNYVQSMCYDYDNGDLYWAQISSGTDAHFVRVDANTGVATDCGLIGGSGAEICGLFMIPAYEPDAPSGADVTSVTISPAEATLRVGQTATFTATVLPVNAENKDVTWSVDDESVIAVDENGVVIGIAEGVATVTVTTVDGGFTASAIVTVTAPLGDLNVGYYFETDPAAEGWTFTDADGDGLTWVWDTSVMTAYEGSGLIYSNSFVNYYGAVTPDNWAISPAVTIGAGGGSVTLYAMGQDPDYASEKFAIYAGTSADPASMTMVSAQFTATAAYVQYSADLSAFAGQTVYVAIRHYDVTDMFVLDVDQVEIWNVGGGEPTPTPEPPVEMAATFTMGSAADVAGGSTVTVDFTVAGTYEAHTLNVWLNYDNTVLTLDNVTYGDVLADAQMNLGAMVVVDYTTIPGSIRIGATMPTTGITMEGTILSLTFTVPEEFTEAEVIEVLANEFGYCPVGQTIAVQIPTTAVNGTIAPKAVTPPVTGAISLIGLGVLAIATGAGVVLFRKKED